MGRKKQDHLFNSLFILLFFRVFVKKIFIKTYYINIRSTDPVIWVDKHTEHNKFYLGSGIQYYFVNNRYFLFSYIANGYLGIIGAKFTINTYILKTYLSLKYNYNIEIYSNVVPWDI